MKTIRAKFKDGVFTPSGPVEVPEGSNVEFEPRVVPLVVADQLPSVSDEALNRIYEIMSRSYEGGNKAASERHNEHQP